MYPTLNIQKEAQEMDRVQMLQNLEEYNDNGIQQSDTIKLPVPIHYTVEYGPINDESNVV